MIEQMLFQNWTGLLRVLLVGTMAYAGLVIAIRLSGKRTLAQLNAFDFVVTVALGSMLATILLSETVALAEGLVGLATLIGLQYAVTWLSVRRSGIANLMRSEPTLLMRNGEFLDRTLKRERVTRAELLTVIRNSAAADPDQVAAVVFESDGSFSVIPKQRDGGEPDFAKVGLDV